MKQAIVIVGMGELGGVFARGFLGLGHPVYPITRKTSISDAIDHFPDPLLMLVAVGEKELSEILTTLPASWKTKLALLQNELLPRNWEAHNIDHPTVISVWFEKKKGQDCKVILPSPIYGPHAGLLAEALARMDIPAKILSSKEELLFALVLKNVFVLTINIAGLKTGGTVGTLWSEHHALARRIAGEVIDLQERLTGATFSRDALFNGLTAAVNGDPAHKCTGRSAPARLSRVIKMADEAGLNLPYTSEIYQNLSS